MALKKPYVNIPGTTIFAAEQSRRGYHLNMFCMSLMRGALARTIRETYRFYHLPASNTAVGHLILENPPTGGC